MESQYNHFLTQMDQTMQDLRKEVEKEKIAAEQDRLRKIQVKFNIYKTSALDCTTLNSN